MIFDYWGQGSGYYNVNMRFGVPEKRGMQIFKAHIVRIWDCSDKD